MRLNSHSAESQRVRGHLQLLGLNKSEVDNIMSTIKKWETDSGKEWTVHRIKALKAWFVQHLAGNSEYVNTWFKLQKSRNGSIIPGGPFGVLFKDDVFTSHKKTIKALSALMVYTAYKLEKVSNKQVLKTLGSIQGTPLPRARVAELQKVGRKLASNQRSVIQPHVKHFLAKKEGGFNFTPVSLNTGKPFTTAGDKYLMSFLSGLRMPTVRGYLETYFGLPVGDFSIDIESYADVTEDSQYMPLSGKIVVLQERGAKARVIAMSSAAAQVALYPLHKMLDSVLKDLPTDCTHNQEAGALWAARQLESGKTVYSVDLSGATDNFPISLQLGFLKGLGLSDEAKLLESLSKGQWMLDVPLQEAASKNGYLDAVSYTKGQPQGLYSSFPLFALTHNLIVDALCTKLRIDPLESFRVLGDDIVLTNDRLHKEYRRFMENSGVPISEDKSLSSDVLAEFAGFIITPNEVYKPAKVPNYSNGREIDNSFMSYLRVVGYDGLKYLPSKVRPTARRVAELPEELGGLGMNPQGKSYSSRSDSFITKIAETKVPRYLRMESSFIRMVGARAYSNDENMILSWLYDQYNLFIEAVNNVIADQPRLTSMVEAGIVEPHSLAYQYSMYSNILDIPDGKVLIGNKSPEATSRESFISELTIWKSRFEDVEVTEYDVETTVSNNRKSTLLSP